MYTKLLEKNSRELKVKVGDRVSIQGNRGIVTKVLKGCDTEWNGEKYVEVKGKEYINVKVKFDKDEALSGTNYDNSVYGGFIVIA